VPFSDIVTNLRDGEIGTGRYLFPQLIILSHQLSFLLFKGVTATPAKNLVGDSRVFCRINLVLHSPVHFRYQLQTMY
jgi:hypothetical protein